MKKTKWIRNQEGEKGRERKRKGQIPGRNEDPLAMNTQKVNLSSPIEEKIARAEEFFRRFSGQLLKKKAIVELLNNVKTAIHAAQKEMTGAGIAEICRQCEEDEGGSCCGAGLENRYDWELLLINLLLGIDLPHKRHDAESCFFLGQTGCLLQARHVICINYVCKKITDLIDPQKIHKLREKEGDEVKFLFLLHEQVKKISMEADAEL
jgi:hypothetical protein